MVTATWEITIKCRDGSRLRFSERNPSVPKNGEILHTGDAGQIISARIDACHEEPPKGGYAIVCFQVMATEI